jgi:NADPH-dependent 2,4-dienoyl-CoA reductase/sulfur reductase-like enzyme
MTPDRTFAPEVMAMNLVPYMRSLQKHDVTFTVTYRLESVQRDGDGLLAIVGSDYGGVRKERCVDQVVVNHGTRPLDELYFALQPLSANGGAVDYPALLAGQVQPVAPAGWPSSCSGSAMPCRRATPTPPSTTRCGW